jgi:hypothetical protein
MDFGLLDRTHLRFFTQSSADGLLANADWVPTWKRSSVGQPPLFRMPERYLQWLERWPTLFAVQFLFDAAPSSDLGASLGGD